MSSNLHSQGSRLNLGKDRSVVVVGAGFSGLVAAYYLRKAGFRVDVFEEQSKPGGLISTIDVGSGLVETGANGILNSPIVEELCSELGVQLQSTRPESRRRFLFVRERLRAWPFDLKGSIALIWFLIRFFLFKNSLTRGLFGHDSIAPQSGESIENWSARVFGENSAREAMVTALQGIYAGDPDKLSASLVLNKFFSSSKEVGVLPSTKYGKGTVAPAGGMGQLIRAIYQHLVSETVLGGVKFHFNSNYSLGCVPPDRPVIVATSSHRAAHLLSRLTSVRSGFLARIDNLPIISTTLFLSYTENLPKGFGGLFPPKGGRPYLGFLNNHYIFTDRARNCLSETWLMGGAMTNRVELFAMSDEAIIERVLAERRSVFGEKAAKQKLLSWRITRWPRAIPHYTVELEKMLFHLRGFDNNVLLHGNYLGQIGLSKILERAKRIPLKVAAGGQWK